MKTMVAVTALAMLVAGCAEICGPAPGSAPATAASASPPAPPAPEPPIPPLVSLPAPTTPESDVFAMLAAQRGGQPSFTDVELAARYYCTSHAKLPQFVSRDLPPELMRQSMPSYDLITYRCVEPPLNH
jgi:hypothetical protein